MHLQPPSRVITIMAFIALIVLMVAVLLPLHAAASDPTQPLALPAGSAPLAPTPLVPEALAEPLPAAPTFYGVVQGSNGPAALLDRYTLGVGETLRGYVVLAIGPHWVRLGHGHQQLKLPLFQALAPPLEPARSRTALSRLAPGGARNEP